MEITANLTIYFDHTESIELELSKIQFKAICKALGITEINFNSYKCWSDDTVKKINKLD